MQDDNIQFILKNVFAASPHKHIKCNICKYKYSKYVKSDNLYKSDLEFCQNVRMLLLDSKDLKQWDYTKNGGYSVILGDLNMSSCNPIWP